MERYSKINNITGWIVFAIALCVYCLTIEPTASFWDCPEFILTAYKLEVGHSPGAPFYMLVGNLFSQLTSDVTKVARMVNYVSATTSAACILFLFWSITHLVRKLITEKDEQISTSKTITIIGSGLVGALVYTFSDTFWFSAVEAEVYAFSSLFTAVVFWLILKWEDVADQPNSDRFLVLIAYLIGLSVGVHLLNLLCLPAVVLVYYYKRVPNANLKGSLMALALSFALIGIVLYGIVPGTVKMGGWFEVFFVNTLSMPYNSGVIAYLVALAIAMVWGIYETFKVKSEKRMVVAFVTTVALLGIPFYGYGTKSVVYGAIIITLMLAGLLWSIRKEKGSIWRISPRTLNTTLLSLMMIVIGYSSYAVIIVRSSANPPMDQNSPEDIFSLGKYLAREQYYTPPLFYGQAYSSKLKLEQKDGYCTPVRNVIRKDYYRAEKNSPEEKDRYESRDGKVEVEYAQNMFFPRMHSSEHAQEYHKWVDIKGTQVPYDECGRATMITMPTQWENIQFFFNYQLKHMYWRYFLWNFVGRQNDLPSYGEPYKGNVATGISFIDNAMLGNQELLPKELKENKGHNVYYGLPLLLGLIGLLWQGYRGQKGIKQFWVVFLLFFMTGIAIILHINQTPMQPRERDYAYVGSFYAFAIWVGFGVAALIELVNRKIKDKENIVAIAVTVLALFVPIQMASQNWDDHDRSGRTATIDFGQNYLSTLDEKGNPIIFTNGDNDTFPLWYSYEVEGFRTDTRTCNLSYLQTDWYIDQMKRPAYNSPALPITWERKEYAQGKNEALYVRPEYMQRVQQLFDQGKKEAEEGNDRLLKQLQSEFGENPYELKNIMKHWVRSSRPERNLFPTDSIVIKIDKEAVLRSGMKIPEKLNGVIPEYMEIKIQDEKGKPKNMLSKSELMMLEIIQNANWERPLYMSMTVGPGVHFAGLEKFFVEEGLAYRITPFDNEKLDNRADTEKMYDNLMNKFKFGGMNKKGVYLNEDIMKLCHTQRRIFVVLADELIKEGKNEKAKKVLDYVEEQLPEYNIPYDWMNGAIDMANMYYKLGDTEKADYITQQLAEKSIEYCMWILSLQNGKRQSMQSMFRRHFSILNELIKTSKENGRENIENAISKNLDEIFAVYKALEGR